MFVKPVVEIEPSYVVISQDKWEEMKLKIEELETLEAQHERALKDLQRLSHRIKEYEGKHDKNNQVS